MLRKFKITVDGKEYLVEMEEIGGVAPVAPVAAPAPVVQAPVQEAVAEPAPVANATVTPASAEAMPSPMPGSILKILVNIGDTVEVNQPLMILEAMKMENEIVAGKAGIVSGIHVSAGQTVNAGDALITIN